MEWMIVFPRRSRLRYETSPSVQRRQLRTAGACPWPVSSSPRPWGPCGRPGWSDKRETLARARRRACCSSPAMQTTKFFLTKHSSSLLFYITIIWLQPGHGMIVWFSPAGINAIDDLWMTGRASACKKPATFILNVLFYNNRRKKIKVEISERRFSWKLYQTSVCVSWLSSQKPIRFCMGRPERHLFTWKTPV